VCGISGFCDFKAQSSREILVHMTDRLRHRGPDDAGYLLLGEPHGQVGLGHRRLSVVDLSPKGHQPMVLGDLTIVYNGEVYNFHAVRKELESLGHRFASNSDTEVVLAAYKQWGHSCVERFIGMFAFVIYDAGTHTLHACRDRAGVKPLYYYWRDGLFLFASELKSLREHPRFAAELDAEAVRGFLKYGYVPTPTCIFSHTYKLSPGHWLCLDAAGRLTTEQYWSVDDCYRRPLFDISEEDALAELRTVMTSAFGLRLVADVPVGLFLSGGYDSALVASILSRECNVAPSTFTVGFEDPAFDESVEAASVARYLGTSHTALRCTEADALALVPKLPDVYDEPFGDSSAVPTLLVSQAARQHVTVALSADGGDETFAGYHRYRAVTETLARRAVAPRAMQVGGGGAARALAWLASAAAGPTARALESAAGYASAVLLARDTSELLENEVQVVPNVEARGLLTADWRGVEPMPAIANVYRDGLSALLAHEYRTYLLDDILVKVDRATMHVGLEGREPLLDHRIIELVARLPSSMKLRGERQKHILKQLAHRYVPPALLDRPKRGFAVPIEHWMRTQLRPLLDHYLDDRRIRAGGVFEPRVVASYRSAFLRGSRVRPRALWVRLWLILMFEMWREKWY